MLNGTDCFGTLRKKSNLPGDFWLWKPKLGDTLKAKFDGEIGIMRWNDVTKTNTVKFVSMMSTIHLFELVDSNKKDRHTGDVIKKPDVIIGYNKMMGGVDLVSRGCYPIHHKDDESTGTVN